MANVKYYFEATSWLYPFLGAGLGYAGTKFGGDLQGSTGGFAFQGLAGADVRFSRNVGLYLEHKYLSATTADKSSQPVEVGGTGVFAGIRLGVEGAARALPRRADSGTAPRAPAPSSRARTGPVPRESPRAAEARPAPGHREAA